MQFTNTLVLLTSLLSLAAADGIFAITGTGSTSASSTSVTLTVQNGLTTDPPTCSGTSAVGNGLPASGSIPCSDGYALTFVWNTETDGIAATYTNPNSGTFTYNVPNNGCDGAGNCAFGFTDLFPGKMRMAKARV